MVITKQTGRKDRQTPLSQTAIQAVNRSMVCDGHDLLSARSRARSGKLEECSGSLLGILCSLSSGGTVEGPGWRESRCCSV